MKSGVLFHSIIVDGKIWFYENIIRKLLQNLKNETWFLENITCKS